MYQFKMEEDKDTIARKLKLTESDLETAEDQLAAANDKNRSLEEDLTAVKS